MTSPATFPEFLAALLELWNSTNFKGADFLTYLQQHATHRRGDEASIVDAAVVGPLLELLGFARGEQFYNVQHQDDRPDFAPADAAFGTCFLVEDKSTALDLTLNLADPDSHLSQIARYVRARAVRLGWLTNGRRLTVWNFAAPDAPTKIIDLDLPSVIAAPDDFTDALTDLFDLCRRDSFADTARMERELATDADTWERQALPLGTGNGHEALLVESLQRIVAELQADARRTLAEHLRGFAEFESLSGKLADDAQESASQTLEQMRQKALDAFEQMRLPLGLEDDDRDALTTRMLKLEQDPRAFASVKAVLSDARGVLNAARQRKNAKTLPDLDGFVTFRDALQTYANTAFGWHQRRAGLRQKYRAAAAVHDDYAIWASLVSETMLGGLDEDARRDEFALQAAYVVFIRLLLIRVCEDKGIFPHRFLTDGGFKHWQEDIERYLTFANGNPYDPLLDMAYANAQNIYAHFFTGRELFNWYRLGRERLVMALYQLSRFHFGQVNSDIVGTVYATYVSRKEKKKKGQYYTPPEIVAYILDEVGYAPGSAIIGAGKRLIDPACGSGTFLVAAARRLLTAYSQTPSADPVQTLAQVQQNLFGFDLNPFACYLAEVNLLIQTLDLVKAAHDAGKRPRLAPFHIYNVDALARPSGMFYNAHFNTRLAEENDVVEQIKRREPGSPYVAGFAFVVANPPYGAALSDAYKETLRAAYPEVFFGAPDTYTFFFQLGLEFLSAKGRLGFITPNTFLMGTNTAALRGQLLKTGRIAQIVDLPQGIWPDATVDCTLLFLTREPDEAKRAAQTVDVKLMDVRDGLEKLTARAWTETLTQPQSAWMDDPRHEMNIRSDALLESIEQACRVSSTNGSGSRILRLDEVVVINRGIEPYHSREQGNSGIYIKLQRELKANEQNWKPLLDSTGYVGRYELRWGVARPHLNYGEWLYRAYEPKYYESPKLLVQSMRNRSLKRRLVAAYDEQKFYNRHNFNNIIAGDKGYDLKYILALFNSSLLNYWFGRKFDNVNINPAYFRQLPIFPADTQTQAEIAAQADVLLDAHAWLNGRRAQGCVIRHKRDGSADISIPYDGLLREMQTADPDFPTLSLYEAAAARMVMPMGPNAMAAQLGTRIYVPDKYPDVIVLRHNKLWLQVKDDSLREYLVGYLRRPQWRGRTWDEIKSQAMLPETPEALTQLFAAEAAQRVEIQTRLRTIAQTDEALDTRILDLYGITAPADRARILGSAPPQEEADEEMGEDADA